MISYGIVGKGTMGSAIGGILARGGDVQHYTREHIESGAVDADVVVLAVPYAEVSGILDRIGDRLAGKTVIDISNPVDFDTFDGLVVPAGSSATAEIQKRLPDSAVLKAFNTNFGATLASGRIGDDVTTVLVAGDDEAAKEALVQTVIAAGLQAIDAGGLSRAHELEAIGFLQIGLAAAERISWTGGLAVVR